MILRWRPVSIGDGPPISTSLTAQEAARLAELATGRCVIEVGSAYGFSTITMALTATHVTTIDPHSGYGSLPDSLAQLQDNIAAYGVRSRIRVVRTTSDDYLPGCSPGAYGLVFIDGDHRYDAVRADLENAWDLLPPKGVLAVHDVGEESCPDVQRAVLDKFDANRGATLTDTLWVAWK